MESSGVLDVHVIISCNHDILMSYKEILYLVSYLLRLQQTQVNKRVCQVIFKFQRNQNTSLRTAGPWKAYWELKLCQVLYLWERSS